MKLTFLVYISISKGSFEILFRASGLPPRLSFGAFQEALFCISVLSTNLVPKFVPIEARHYAKREFRFFF